MEILRSLFPLRNAVGFGAADFIELTIAVLLFAAYWIWPVLAPRVRRLAIHTGWCVPGLVLLAMVLRLALVPHFPVPTPSGSDDFSHLLMADTLLHFRLANPPHVFHRFFEAIYVLQEPTYSSMYPPGQGLVLAIGRLLFGTPWAGVLLSVGALCGLSYWALRAWTTPEWALAGGLLAVYQFGPLNQWANTYWANALPAVAGCLVIGSLPRFRSAPRPKYAVLTGLGLAVHLITRPFESILLAVGVVLFLPLLRWRGQERILLRAGSFALVPVVLASTLLLFQNHAVTGSWTTLPYVLSRYQYGIPATFVFEPNPVPHRPLTQEQDLDYRAQAAIHGDQPESLRSFLERLAYRVRYYRFYCLPPLYLALVAFLLTIRELRYAWVVLVIVVFALGSNLYPYFYPHYIGACTCLFLLMSVVGLEKLSRWHAGRFLFLLCTAMFLFWYGIRLSGQEDLLPLLAYDEWDFVNHGDPDGRIAVNQQLAGTPGKQLVFVRYSPKHDFHEWIHNDAEVDSSRIIWALDLGAAENEQLIQHYPDRHVWIVEPDLHPPRLQVLQK